MVYAGIDVHRKRRQVSLIDVDGRELLNRNVDNGSEAMLADEGLKVEGEKLWSDEGQQWLAGVSVRDMHRLVIDDCCGMLDALEIPIGRLETDIRKQAKTDPRVEALCVLPGVGLITAMTLVSEIGDINRFPTARKLCAWAGLTPSVRNSDNKVRHGHITKAGPAAVRWVLTEAGYHARRFPPFNSTFEAMTKRRGKHNAGVAPSRQQPGTGLHILTALEAAQT